MSEIIKHKGIHEAMLAVKQELGFTIAADAKNYYGAGCTSLQKTLETVMPICWKHGLDVQQAQSLIDNLPVLITTIRHMESGEMMRSESLLSPEGPGPQKLGAAETYVKRRAILTAFNIVTEEDPDLAHDAPQGRVTQQTPARTNQPTKAAYNPTSSKGTASKRGLEGKLIPIFKKYAGQTYGQVSLTDLIGSSTWLKAEADKKGEGLSGRAAEFIADVEALSLAHEFGAEAMGFAPSKHSDDVPF